MPELTENFELNNFYKSWRMDIEAELVTAEDGADEEQIFTQNALDLLAESNEVENFRLSFDAKDFGTAKQHKINAYSISENYETVDLFIAVYKGTDVISKTGTDEIEQAAKRITNFFRKAIYANDYEKSKVFRSEYIDIIEESSEIFQFAYTLGKDKDLRENLVRVNATILTNGIYNGEFPGSLEISGYKIFFKVFDLNALFNVSEKSHIPIQINFTEEGYKVPCISSPSLNDEYQSYLAIIPGIALANIYERFGARLMEQNVRSFLQFTGKINKGIRDTIRTEPEMFLAFNNGIAATADEVEFISTDDNKGLLLSSVKDLQIVNGGQTTASIYHTWKKDKADISEINVQVKLSVIKDKDNFSTIVSRIAEYANTQNKVSVADLSSNRPYHIELEKLSRTVYTPITNTNNLQTRWFYERARGQYKNSRLKEGFTKSRQKAFDLKNPKSQMFTKEELAKYINSYSEITEGRKVVIGPHYVVRGNQKNYIQFMNYNLESKLSNVYFEDQIAKAILFKSAEKLYGVKPYSIGDMRYITVPYSISLLTYLTKGKIDLYKIWRNQGLSDEMKSLLYDIMQTVEDFIKDSAPGGLYGEWAKKEECWQNVQSHKFDFDLSSINGDLIDPKKKSDRYMTTEDEFNRKLIQEELEKIMSVPASVWKKIEDYGKQSGELSILLQDAAFTIANKIRTNSKLQESDRKRGISILDIIIEKFPELLFNVDDFPDDDGDDEISTPISIDLVKKMVSWDKRNKRLKDHNYLYLLNIANGSKPLTAQAKKYAALSLEKLRKLGFVLE